MIKLAIAFVAGFLIAAIGVSGIVTYVDGFVLEIKQFL